MSNKDKLTSEEIKTRHEKLSGWDLEEEQKIKKDFSFKNFKEALKLTNQAGEIAEELSHHPDIYLTWGKVSITIQTHETGSLTEKDFELAESIDSIAPSE